MGGTLEGAAWIHATFWADHRVASGPQELRYWRSLAERYGATIRVEGGPGTLVSECDEILLRTYRYPLKPGERLIKFEDTTRPFSKKLGQLGLKPLDLRTSKSPERK